ncbi:hypothetical protein P8452_52219 [Trifolium repens]|nr:hypothetical protein P8452_52219 [Trifolium repens]
MLPLFSNSASLPLTLPLLSLSLSLVDSSSPLPITTVGVAAAAIAAAIYGRNPITIAHHQPTPLSLMSDLVMWKDNSQDFNFRVFEENRFGLSSHIKALESHLITSPSPTAIPSPAVNTVSPDAASLSALAIAKLKKKISLEQIPQHGCGRNLNLMTVIPTRVGQTNRFSELLPVNFIVLSNCMLGGRNLLIGAASNA